MSNALMMAIIGTLRPVPATATGITVVGSESTSRTVSFGSGVTSQTVACALPAGCVAGDAVILSCSAQAYSSFAWVAPTGAATVLAPQIYSTLAVAVFVYVLTSGDASTGSVNLPCTVTSGGYTVGVSIIADVRRNVSLVPVDVAGALAKGAFASSTPATFTAPGITTTKNGDLLQYVLFASASGSNAPGTYVTPPEGWVNGAYPNSVNAISTFTGYKPQVTSGATGDVALVYAHDSGTSGSYVTAVFALRPKAPAIALSYDLPATATIGTAYSGSITATPVDGATGPVTITATSLPDGVTAGTQVDNGDGTYTLPISGTPTTAQTVSIGVSATNGVLSASASVGVVVSATASSVVIKASNGNAIASGSPPALVPVTIAVTAGDQITVMYSASGTFNAPFKPAISDTAGNTYTMLTPTLTSASANQIIWTAIANATGTITISAKGSWYYGYECIEAYATTPATYSTPTGVSVSGSTSWDIALPSTPPAGSLALAGVRFPVIAYTVTELTEDVSSYGYGLNPSVSTAHIVAPVSTALGSYKFAGNAAGNYTTIVLSPK